MIHQNFAELRDSLRGVKRTRVESLRVAAHETTAAAVP